MQKILESDKETVRLKIDEFKRGKNPDNSIIGTYKSLSYRRMKQAKNPLARGFVDLMNTKSYVNKLFVKKVNRLQYSFISKDSKDKMLADKYGEKIRGFSEFSYNTRANFYAIELGKKLKKIVNL